jgi:7-cyano-7-deazaguanine synthase in queuosine biosynthesis
MSVQQVVVRARGMMDKIAKEHRFTMPTDLSVRFETPVGSRGFSLEASDLVEVAAIVCRVERMLPSWRTSNRPTRIEATIPVRRPGVWRNGAGAQLQDVLRFLTDVEWVLEFRGGGGKAVSHEKSAQGVSFERVTLFSGGLDSACGAALLRLEAEITRLVSIYTRDKTHQCTLASELGHGTPCQVTVSYGKLRRRSFLTRSLLFMAVAAAVASSHDLASIHQYENGVLGLAIAPAPGVVITRHAHPEFHRRFKMVCNSVLGGNWTVTNPFLLKTKAECVSLARGVLGRTTDQILQTTQSCWYYWSNHGHKGDKRSGKACGVCIPCIVRKTALSGGEYERDLLKPKVRREAEQADFFEDLLGFVHDVSRCGDASEFYGLLDANSRILATYPSAPPLEEQFRVYKQFA